MTSPAVLHPAVVADRLLYAASSATRGPATIGDLLDAMVDAVSAVIHDGDPAPSPIRQLASLLCTSDANVDRRIGARPPRRQTGGRSRPRIRRLDRGAGVT